MDKRPIDQLEGTEEENKYFKAFKQAVDERNEVQIDSLMKKKGILMKYFLFDDDDDEWTFIGVAAKRGTIQLARKIFKLAPNVVNFKGHNGQTPIYFAITNSIEMVNLFIKEGADLNTRNVLNETPLQHAIRHSAQCVKVLLHNGANVGFTSEEGETMLHEALLSGTEETVRLILNKMLSEIRNNYKEAKNCEDIVRKLLLNKDDLKIVKKDIPLLIFFAAKIGKSDIFKMMLNEIRKHFDLVQNNPENSCHETRELNFGGYFKRTALHYATRQQLPQVIRFLLKAGANVNCKTKDKFTPLHYAASLENEEICKILLSFKADLNSTSSDLGSPLYQVCGYNTVRDHLEEPIGYYYEEYYDARICLRMLNLKLMKLLLENGANPDIPADEGNTPFLETCRGGKIETLKILLEFGADFKIRNTNGNSALHEAVLGNCLENVNFLLEKGIDINIRNNENLTPLLELMESCKPRNLEMIEYLVNRGADINDGSPFNMTPLHWASIVLESMKLVEGLLALGADWKIECKASLSTNELPKFGCGRKLLISFIALSERKMGNYIISYFKKNDQELTQAIDYFTKSRLEVKKLKALKIIQENSISFYDFLTGNVYDTVQVVKNEKLKKIFKTRNYFKEFPCYWFLLQKRFERIIALTVAVDKMSDVLTNSLSSFPLLITCKFLNSLNPFDFQNLDTNLSESNRLDEQEVNLNLSLRKYESKIVEILETGVMVTLLEYPSLQPILLLYSQMQTESVPNPKALSFKVGGKILVMYVGRYPKTRKIRLTGKIM